MLRVFKSSGYVTSSAKEKPTTKNKGRVELCLYDLLESTEDGKEYELEFMEFGNYGKPRWTTNILLSEKEVKEMSTSLLLLLSGKIVETLNTDETETQTETAAEKKGE
ncbi:hypothetical protein HYV49_01135 [Candidatus Pacearchaeota archaeon]|nr:hypothetical protein [Candidatus Pacearchaeota archaeon]